MDISNLNYRQLQSQAKKYGIKANQKIEILRLKINEAVQNDNYSNSSKLFEKDFMDDIVKRNTSTPAFNKLESSLITTLEMSSTDDIEKMFGSDIRNSQFFDNVLNFSKKDVKTSPNIDKELINQIDKANEDIINFSDSIENSSHKITDQRIRQSDNCRKIRKLNTTFELNENEIKESKITVEQRKTHTVDEIVGKLNVKLVDRKPVCKAPSNVQHKTTMRENILKANPSRINNPMISNHPNSSVYRKSIIVTKHMTKPAEKTRQSTCLSNHLSSNPIYQKKPARASLLPVFNKPNCPIGGTTKPLTKR